MQYLENCISSEGANRLQSMHVEDENYDRKLVLVDDGYWALNPSKADESRWIFQLEYLEMILMHFEMLVDSRSGQEGTDIGHQLRQFWWNGRLQLEDMQLWCNHWLQDLNMISQMYLGWSCGTDIEGEDLCELLFDIQRLVKLPLCRYEKQASDFLSRL